MNIPVNVHASEGAHTAIDQLLVDGVHYRDLWAVLLRFFLDHNINVYDNSDLGLGSEWIILWREDGHEMSKHVTTMSEAVSFALSLI